MTAAAKRHMQIFSMQLKKTWITPPLGCRAESAEISRPALTKAEHQEHSAQCNCSSAIIYS